MSYFSELFAILSVPICSTHVTSQNAVNRPPFLHRALIVPYLALLSVFSSHSRLQI
jgi:hypothetical protein